MAFDLWPYSQRESGPGVSDSEHEALWTPIADGVLPGESSSALAVSVSGGTWNVQPGRLHIAGHVLKLDSVESGAVPGPSTATRYCTVAAYIDRTQTPWTYGVRLVLGNPGGGKPSLSKSPTGRYEVALRSFAVAATGAVTVLDDERVVLEKAGRPVLTAWKTLTLAGGFVIYDDTPQYRVLFDGRRVEFRGTVRRSDNAPMNASSGLTIATVPAEIRPSSIERFTGQATLVGSGSSGACRVEVRSDGALRIWSNNSPTWVGINGGIWID